jgi:hypothetical protein
MHQCQAPSRILVTRSWCPNSDRYRYRYHRSASDSIHRVLHGLYTHLCLISQPAFLHASKGKQHQFGTGIPFEVTVGMRVIERRTADLAWLSLRHGAAFISISHDAVALLITFSCLVFCRGCSCTLLVPPVRVVTLWSLCHVPVPVTVLVATEFHLVDEAQATQALGVNGASSHLLVLISKRR